MNGAEAKGDTEPMAMRQRPTETTAVRGKMTGDLCRIRAHPTSGRVRVRVRPPPRVRVRPPPSPSLVRVRVRVRA